MHETKQSTTPSPEFVFNPGQYPKSRTTTSSYSYSYSFIQILIFIVIIIVVLICIEKTILFQVEGTFENVPTSLQIKRYEYVSISLQIQKNEIVQSSLKIKRYEDIQNLNISCETVQLLYLNNKISDCSLLSWITPDQVKCTTNTSADNSTDSNFHSRCTIQCSTETFTKVHGETINELIKIAQWLNIESPGLSHSGNYSCYLNGTYGKLVAFEFTEKMDRACQYYDQCRSRICHQNQCRCRSENENYLPESDQCIQRKKLDQECQFDKQCHFNTYLVHSALVGFRPNFTQPSCISSKCQCPLGTVKHRIANNQVCISKASHGEPCFTNAQCQLQSEQLYCGQNYEDNTETCLCKDGYRWGQDECVPIRKCVGEKDCGDGQFCDQGNQGVCRCKDGFRWKQDECEPHRTCDSNRNCEDGQHCEQNLCKCDSPETMDSRGKCFTGVSQLYLHWKIISIFSIVVVLILCVFAYLMPYTLLRKFIANSISTILQASSARKSSDSKNGNFELQALYEEPNSNEVSQIVREDGEKKIEEIN